MTLPATRVRDMHRCKKGHPDNPVVEHSANVWTGGLLQARILDACDCPDKSENIKSGSSNVLVNGLPCARKTDLTIHDGEILLGRDDVLVGGATVVFPIEMTGDADFRERVKRSLAEIYSTPTGKELMRILNEKHTRLRIAPGGNSAGTSPDGTPTVFWDAYTAIDNKWHPTLSLGHELCHASHGTPASANEERRTVGTKPPLDANGNRVFDANGKPNGTHIRDRDGALKPAPDYSGEVPSENSLRRDLGWPSRDTYVEPSTIKPGQPEY